MLSVAIRVFVIPNVSTQIIFKLHLVLFPKTRLNRLQSRLITKIIVTVLTGSEIC